jgi:hypothetical protein
MTKKRIICNVSGKFISNLDENDVSSYSNWMMGVIYDSTYIKY